MGSAPARRPESVAARYERIRDSVAVEAARGADDVAAAPRVRLVISPTAYSGSGFVEAAFRLSEDAYVLVVAVDLDRRFRVLHPESPDESGFATAGSGNRLTRFFAGFGGAQFGRYTSYDLTQRISPFGGEGVMIAIASDRPLQLERLMDAEGDWDEDKLANLVFDQSLAGAAHALGRALVLTGQEYSTDYTTLGGRRTLGGYTSLASRSFGDCGGFGAMDAGFGTYPFGYGDGPRYDGMGAVLLGFHRMGGQLFARYAYASGRCGRPLYYDVPVPEGRVTPPDTTKHDSTVVARRRPRFPGAPRFPSVSPDSASGPLTRRGSAGAGTDESSGRLRPPVAGGLRFRPPEQLPAEGMGPSERRMTPRDLDAPARRAPSAEQSPPDRGGDVPGRVERMQPVERVQPVERRQEPRAEPVRAEPARAEPVRAEPVRPEPVRAEPASREPARPQVPMSPREPARR